MSDNLLLERECAELLLFFFFFPRREKEPENLLTQDPESKVPPRGHVLRALVLTSSSFFVPLPVVKS